MAQANAAYLSGFTSLKEIAPNQPILEAITSEGDADAVLATYGAAQFLLVEFNTPQLAGDNDRAIKTKLDELKRQGQPVPSKLSQGRQLFSVCFRCCVGRPSGKLD